MEQLEPDDAVVVHVHPGKGKRVLVAELGRGALRVWSEDHHVEGQHRRGTFQDVVHYLWPIIDQDILMVLEARSRRPGHLRIRHPGGLEVSSKPIGLGNEELGTSGELLLPCRTIARRASAPKRVELVVVVRL
jgi:hypothetical protein